ncbi:MAG TPA: hypothetical protein VLC95_16840 [Anaerolineae bacterium]|nr:hypothetical protein [Anaerolineae bacterium]
MTELPSVDAIIQDIEFELLLGVTPTGEVGEALSAIRREQNRLRSVYAGARRRADSRDVVADLLRLNDLLLDVFHELLSRLASVESVIERAAGRTPAAAHEGSERVAQEAVGGERTAAPHAPDLWPDVDLDVKPVALPFAGRLLDRFRLALHKVVLYYVHRLAEQQGAVNVYHADEVEQLKTLVGNQQRRLAELEAEICNLRAQAGTGRTDRDVGNEDG